jgi:hypothetical protein
MPHTLTIEYGDDLLLSLGMSADDDEQYSAPDFSQTCPCQGTNLVLESRPVDRLNLRDVDDTGFAEIGFALTQANVTSESGEFEVARDGEDDRRAAPPRLGTGGAAEAHPENIALPDYRFSRCHGLTLRNASAVSFCSARTLGSANNASISARISRSRLAEATRASRDAMKWLRL